MAEAYWTHCMYCRGMICGVEIMARWLRMGGFPPKLD
jgi:hypothetical protein